MKDQFRRLEARFAVSVALCVALGAGGAATAQTFDLCGCADAGALSLGDFVINDPATYPPGTIASGDSVTIPLPDDGVLIFDSMRIVRESPYLRVYLYFGRNTANTPATVLVRGDVVFGQYGGIRVGGSDGIASSSNQAGSLGGPGGFRGGDGAYLATGQGPEGGAGYGPGGGEPGTASNRTGVGGTFVGAPDLLPLVGGSGGGGGGSSDIASNCWAASGGGGGGAILLAVNGTLNTGSGGYKIEANGGAGNYSGNSNCGGYSAGGSGGAIRIIAGRIQGSGGLSAQGGNPANSNLATARGGPGSIRIETLDEAYTGGTIPQATFSNAPSPITLPTTPQVRIATVDGAIPPDPPQGWLGDVDIVVSAPGPVTFLVESDGVPGGTLVDLTAKPQYGALPQAGSEMLTNCDNGLRCEAQVVLDLEAGRYAVEARATYQVP